MKIIEKAAVIADALQKYGHQLSPLEREHAQHVLDSINALEPALKRVESEIETDSFIFAKITPRRIEPQYVYGSQVPCDTVHELAVCGAKLNDHEEWIPDENNVLYKAIFPERVLAEMMFDRQSYAGKQVTLTELNGVALPKYERQEETYANYTRRFDEKTKDVRDAAAQILSMTTDMEATRLTKGDLQNISQLTGEILSHARSDAKFDLELAAERVDENAYHLRSEIQSSVHSAVAKRSLEAAIEYQGKEREITAYQAYFTLTTLTVEVESVIKLLELDEDNAESEALANHMASFTKGISNVNQGMIKISSPCGSPTFFFGDSRYVQEYFIIDLCFTAHEFDEYGDRKLTKGKTLCQFRMTRYQMMELLRTSIGDIWTKATLERNLNLPVATPQLPEDRNSIVINGMKITDESQKLEALVLEVNALVAEKKNNKEHRAKLAAAIIAMVKQLDIEIPARNQSYDDALADLFKNYERDTMVYLQDAMEKSSGLLTDSQKQQVLRIIKMV